MWSPAGSQAVDWYVWQIWALGLGWLPIPHFGSVHGGSQPLIRFRAHPGAFCLCSQAAGRLSGHAPTRGFRCGSQATDWGTAPTGALWVWRPGSWAACLSGLALTWGFRCGPLAGLQVSAGAAFRSSQSRGGVGRGARGHGCWEEFSN